MSWFEEQIKQRKTNDEQLFSDSFMKIASSVTGEKLNESKIDITQGAIKTILKYYGFESKATIPNDMDDFNDQLEYLCRPFGLMRRQVKLTDGWYKDCIGAILAFKNDDNDTPMALIPDVKGYKYFDGNKVVKINKNNQHDFKQFGYCFYKPFPLRKINSIDLLKYAFSTRSIKDYVVIISFMILSSLIGLMSPKISYFLYQDVIENKSLTLLISTIIFYICLNISTLLFNTFSSLYNNMISTKMSLSVQAATMMRVLSLPANFFRKYSSGELASRTNYVNSLCSSLMSMIFNGGLSSLFSLVYISSIFNYAPNLVIPSLIIIVVTIGFSAITTIIQNKISKEQMVVSSKLSGLTYAMIQGIRKIRLSGSEKRAFSRWAEPFSTTASTSYNPPKIIKYNSLFNMAISLTGTIVMYYFAVKSHVSLAEYSAFNIAYGMLYGAFSGLASLALSTSNIKNILDMAKPILDAVPEISSNKEVVTKLNGNIEFNNVSFKYSDNMPLVIDNLSFKIKAGQYIAIVGKTGCGKSTLIRLLLGFEKPEKGAIYYDGKDINSLDLKSLRRKIGVVMQDGKLFQGDIYSNVVISAPWLTVDDAWKACEIAGIADDIRDMPMGMNTLISEGSGGISGGQRQRLLIARAVASKPKILIFDEATSALDNITQRKVSEALDEIKSTKIVIAHRLSTIKNCDRIVYLENGKIIEDGTYDELIKKDGLFAKLVERQRLNNEELDKSSNK